jgi:hypothetical protein
LVDLIPPVSGLSSVADMLQLHVDGCNIVDDAGDDSGSDEASNITSRDDGWQHLEAAMHDISRQMSDTLIKGVEHAKLRLESTNRRTLFNRRRARKTDKEHEAGIAQPGDTSFLDSFRNVFENGRVFSQEKEEMNNKELLGCYIQHRPQVGNLNQYTSEMHYNTLRYFLFLHVSSPFSFYLSFALLVAKHSSLKPFCRLWEKNFSSSSFTWTTVIHNESGCLFRPFSIPVIGSRDVLD